MRTRKVKSLTVYIFKDRKDLENFVNKKIKNMKLSTLLDLVNDSLITLDKNELLCEMEG